MSYGSFKNEWFFIQFKYILWAPQGGGGGQEISHPNYGITLAKKLGNTAGGS